MQAGMRVRKRWASPRDEMYAICGDAYADVMSIEVQKQKRSGKEGADDANSDGCWRIIFAPMSLVT